MLSFEDQQRLARYVAGDGDPAWRAATREWITADVERRAVFEAEARIQAVAPGSPGWDESAQWETLRASVGIARPALAPRGARAWRAWGGGAPRTAWARWSPFAAGVAAACAAIWLIVTVRSPASPDRGGRVYATRAGERETVSLADGTSLVLAPATTVRVAADYGQRTREVVLVGGEAYFAVTHDATRPFSVRAQHVMMRDVGTAFDVRAYAGERAVQVAVAEGAVEVREGPGANAPLGAGDVATVGDTAIRVAHHADVTTLVAWTRGELAFHAVPLGDVAVALARWYDLDVRVSDERLARMPVTGSFTTESRDQVLSLITAAIGARYARDGRVVTIEAW
jgi:transmembrane sensor